MWRWGLGADQGQGGCSASCSHMKLMQIKDWGRPAVRLCQLHNIHYERPQLSVLCWQLSGNLAGYYVDNMQEIPVLS